MPSCRSFSLRISFSFPNFLDQLESAITFLSNLLEGLEFFLQLLLAQFQFLLGC